LPSRYIRKKHTKVLEAVFVAAVSAMVGFGLSYAVDVCDPEPGGQHGSRDNDSAVHHHQQAGSVATGSGIFTPISSILGLLERQHNDTFDQHNIPQTLTHIQSDLSAGTQFRKDKGEDEVFTTAVPTIEKHVWKAPGHHGSRHAQVRPA
jgi:hypothetical protein